MLHLFALILVIAINKADILSSYFLFQSPADLDLDGRTNGFPEVNGNPLLDATKNNFSRIVSCYCCVSRYLKARQTNIP
jgi:hypothetical protein